MRRFHAFLSFYGEGKGDAYEKFQDQSLSIINCPAKLINEVKEGYVVTDLK
ncbi:MAG TPA: hypothetical protein VJH68_02425 [Candidatus Nanoarchaeia archaeon]|nr:hypothetical protein [Candidatus Nanoarchaeia archaeon]